MRQAACILVDQSGSLKYTVLFYTISLSLLNMYTRPLTTVSSYGLIKMYINCANYMHIV